MQHGTGGQWDATRACKAEGIPATSYTRQNTNPDDLRTQSSARPGLRLATVLCLQLLSRAASGVEMGWGGTHRAWRGSALVAGTHVR